MEVAVGNPPEGISNGLESPLLHSTIPNGTPTLSSNGSKEDGGDNLLKRKTMEENGNGDGDAKSKGPQSPLTLVLSQGKRKVKEDEELQQTKAGDVLSPEETKNGSGSSSGDGSSASEDEQSSKEAKRRKLEKELEQYEILLKKVEQLQEMKKKTPQNSTPVQIPSSINTLDISSPNPSLGDLSATLASLGPALIVLSSGSRKAELDINWQQLTSANLSRQTLFPVSADGKPLKGTPPSFDVLYNVRATKSIYMFPPWVVRLKNADGTPCMEKEDVSLTVVTVDKTQMLPGGCPCGGSSIIMFRQEKGEQVHGKITEGELEFSKLQISCLTGTRGHNQLFRLKFEFVTENSPLFGKSLYSQPIEIGAKGPFTKKSKEE